MCYNIFLKRQIRIGFSVKALFIQFGAVGIFLRKWVFFGSIKPHRRTKGFQNRRFAHCCTGFVIKVQYTVQIDAYFTSTLKSLTKYLKVPCVSLYLVKLIISKCVLAIQEERHCKFWPVNVQCSTPCHEHWSWSWHLPYFCVCQVTLNCTKYLTRQSSMRLQDILQCRTCQCYRLKQCG